MISLMKARVANIEKSYEAIKVKCGMIEEDRVRLEGENKRMVEEVMRQKQLR